MTTYVLDNAWGEERRRLAGIEALYDSGTFRHLEALGIGAGWRCWDVGAGGGTVAAWLAERIGPSGSVLATDIDTRFLDALGRPNIKVRRHDVAHDPLPEGDFDLIHTRLLLIHLAERDVVVEQLASALRPGGWLLLEEWDFSSIAINPALDPTVIALHAKVAQAWEHYIKVARGGGAVENQYGRWLVSRLRGAGLIEVGGEGRSMVEMGGDGFVETHPLRNPQARAALVGGGEVTADEIDAFLALRRSTDMYSISPLMVATWGRKPLER
jgi:SAM-dependent methyltransferase